MAVHICDSAKCKITTFKVCCLKINYWEYIIYFSKYGISYLWKEFFLLDIDIYSTFSRKIKMGTKYSQELHVHPHMDDTPRLVSDIAWQRITLWANHIAWFSLVLPVGGWDDAIGWNKQSFDKANLCSQDIQEVRKKKFFLQLVSHKIMQSYKMSKQLLILCCKRG